jgi:type IV fimbrial biogenesis protein FimT
MLKSGFTMIEMMVVLGIVSIVAAIAIPNIIAWLPDYRLRSSTRDIVSCLQETKMRAIRENANAIVIFTSNGYESFVDDGAGGGTSGNKIKDGGELRITKVDMPSDINLSDNANPAATSIKFGFDGRGFLVTSNGTLLIKNSQLSYRTISLSTAGNIKVKH